MQIVLNVRCWSCGNGHSVDAGTQSPLRGCSLFEGYVVAKRLAVTYYKRIHLTLARLDRLYASTKPVGYILDRCSIAELDIEPRCPR